jgi:hypothetical protein
VGLTSGTNVAEASQEVPLKRTICSWLIGANRVGAGFNRDAQQQHRHHHVVETGDLAHDVRPREVVAALLENLHERMHNGEGVG